MIHHEYSDNFTKEYVPLRLRSCKTPQIPLTASCFSNFSSPTRNHQKRRSGQNFSKILAFAILWGDINRNHFHTMAFKSNIRYFTYGSSRRTTQERDYLSFHVGLFFSQVHLSYLPNVKNATIGTWKN